MCDIGDYLPAECLQGMLLLYKLAKFNANFNLSTYFETFKKLKTNLDRVNYVYDDMKKYDLFPEVTKEGKDDSNSERDRMKGNEAFGGGDYGVALRFYSSSVATAKSTTVLALAYANRSATLYKLGRYQDCLMDIERALANNYPENLEPKLITRRINAEKMQNSSKPLEPFHQEIPEIPSSEKHPQITAANKCIGIETNEEFGRHVVATRDIQIGEILCVEKPYAFSVITETFIHCHTCLELCYNPIPCNNCIYILFCSEDCKNEACNTFHKYECSALATLLAGGTNFINDLIATRVAVSVIHDNSSEPADDGMYRSGRYKEVSELMSGTDKFKVKDLYRRAVNAACVFRSFLKRTSIFNCPNSDIIKNQFKETVLSQMMIHDLNALAIVEFVRNSVGWKTKPFADGLYPFISFFSHSCSPNVESTQYGHTTVLRTNNSIQKGEQCCISYGPRYSKTNKLERISFLNNRYFFECKCNACVYNWKFCEIDLFDLLLFCGMLEINNSLLTLDAELNTDRPCETARRSLPYLIEQLKRYEKFEPRGPALDIKISLACCYTICGNKRVL